MWKCERERERERERKKKLIRKSSQTKKTEIKTKFIKRLLFTTTSDYRQPCGIPLLILLNQSTINHTQETGRTEQSNTFTIITFINIFHKQTQHNTHIYIHYTITHTSPYTISQLC